jgi:hypothetical protein
MPCYYPLEGYYSKIVNRSGKRSITFSKSEAYSHDPIQLPCGVCIGCRLEHSRQWAMRCMHEAQMHEENCFITLTYDDDHLPEYQSLKKDDFQKFMKRLRQWCRREDEELNLPYRKIRFYGCGEYGDNTKRPHYHICIFGLMFHDRQLWKKDGDIKLYISEDLQKLWKFGFTTVGSLTFETAAYTARYCMKKAKGKNKENAYDRIDADTGEIIKIEPEFARMSRRPGIGTDWYNKFNKEVFPNDSVVVQGAQVKPPKFYFNKLEKQMPRCHTELKALRKKYALSNKDKNTLAKLHTRRIVKESQLKQLTRSL